MGTYLCEYNNPSVVAVPLTLEGFCVLMVLIDWSPRITTFCQKPNPASGTGRGQREKNRDGQTWHAGHHIPIWTED